MTDQYKESREEWHNLERDLLTPKPCEHLNIEQESIINPAIGVEYYDVCADCGKETNI